MQMVEFDGTVETPGKGTRSSGPVFIRPEAVEAVGQFGTGTVIALRGGHTFSVSEDLATVRRYLDIDDPHVIDETLGTDKPDGDAIPDPPAPPQPVAADPGP